MGNREAFQDQQDRSFFQDANINVDQANTFQQNQNRFQFDKSAVQRSLAFQQSQFGYEPYFDPYSEAGTFEPLNLPSGASALLGDISTSFSCADRPYGYYADPENFCRIFHICNPTLFGDGTVQTYQYSLMCGEGSVFDQAKLTCVA